MKKVELLAPAGDLEKLKVAILYGADAVFCGGKSFSLRSRASNFSMSDIKEAVIFGKKYDSKIYVTTNIIPHEEDLEGLEEYLIELDKYGVAGIISSSPIIIEKALEIRTQMEVHLSTQQTASSLLSVKFWENQGIDRVVLARETTLKEIQEISNGSNLEIEVFVHGGMCSSYSGRCTLSNNMTDRDANRGGCAHSCRWNYSIYSDNEKINNDGFYSFASKDLESIEYIDELIKSNVSSLKIEGRMKSIHYIATVVNTYRRLIDAIYSNIEFDYKWFKKEIKKCENRLSGKGFFNGIATKDEHLYDNRSEIPNKLFIGIILDYNELTKVALVEQRNYFEKGEIVEILSPNYIDKTFVVDEIKDKEQNLIDVARHPKELLHIKIPFKVSKYDMIRRVKK